MTEKGGSGMVVVEEGILPYSVLGRTMCLRFREHQVRVDIHRLEMESWVSGGIIRRRN